VNGRVRIDIYVVSLEPLRQTQTARSSSNNTHTESVARHLLTFRHCGRAISKQLRWQKRFGVNVVRLGGAMKSKMFHRNQGLERRLV
jgi:hypothetical protein